MPAPYPAMVNFSPGDGRLGQLASLSIWYSDGAGNRHNKVMGEILIDLYGCDTEQLSAKFLRSKFDAMDTQKQGLLSMADLLNALSSRLSISQRDRETATGAIPNAISFEDFYAAVTQTLQFHIIVALERACTVHRSGYVIILNTGGIPAGFEQLLKPLEREAGVEDQTKYVICKDKTFRSSLWRIHAVMQEPVSQELMASETKSTKSIQARLRLPLSW